MENNDNCNIYQIIILLILWITMVGGEGGGVLCFVIGAAGDLDCFGTRIFLRTEYRGLYVQGCFQQKISFWVGP